MKPAISPLLLSAAVILGSLTGFCAGLPDLAPFKLQLPQAIVSPPRPGVVITWGVTNQGVSGVNFWNDYLYLSTNATFDESALYVAEFGVPWPLYPGDYFELSQMLTLPLYTNGTYHLFVVADGRNSVAESVETNNIISASFEFTSTPPDLVPVAFVVPPVLITNANAYLSVAWAVTNQGIGPAIPLWAGSITFSADPNSDPSDLWLASLPFDEVIPSGGFAWRTNTVQLPVLQDGTYYYFLRVGWDDPLLESNNTNNVLMTSVQVKIVKPDLVPVHVGVGSSTMDVPVNPQVNIVWGVTNQGAGPAGQPLYWSDFIYLSRDAVLDSSDIQLVNSWHYDQILSEGMYWGTNTITAPILTNGTYYLILSVDNYQWLPEESELNNQLVVPVTFSLNRPDFAPLVAGVPAAITGAPNPMIKIAWGVTNQGSSLLWGYQNDKVLFSTRSTLDSTAVALTERYRWDPFPTGGSLWSTNELRLPVTTSGDYFLLIVADAGGPEADLNPVDNLMAVPISIQILPTDLVATSFIVASNYTGSPNPSLKMAWRVENRGEGSTGPGNSWVDSIFFSLNPIRDTSDLEIFSNREAGPVAAGASYGRTNLIQIPTSVSGDYYLFFITDSRSEMVESKNDNNELMVPIHLTIEKPDTMPLILDMPLSITGAPNPNITFRWAVTNQGLGDAKAYWADSVWFSQNAIREDNDTLIADWGSYYYDVLRAGESLIHTNSVQIPCTTNGTYYLIFQANRGQQLAESNLANNLLAVPFEFYVVYPDLVPVALQMPAVVTAPPNPSVNVSWCVTNQGPGEALTANWWSSWYDRTYLSRDPVLDAQDLPVGNSYEWAGRRSLAPGENYGFTNVSVQLPLQEEGDYFLIFATDWSGVITETVETNNTIAVPFRYEMRRSDLATMLIDVPVKVVGPPNPRIQLVWAVTNQGPIEASATYAYAWRDAVLFSRDALYDWRDMSMEVSYQSTPLAPGTAVWHTNSVRPPVMESGTYYLAFKADLDNAVPESNENNNTVFVPVDFTVFKPDVVPVRLEVPAILSVPPRPTIVLEWAVTNQGPVEADWDWSERVTISTNLIPSASDVTIGYAGDIQMLPAAGVVRRSITVQTEIVQSGTYYFTVRVNENHSLIESDYSNNTITVPVNIQILPPDLVPLTSMISTEFTGPPNPRLSLSWGVKNQGEGFAKGSWVDSVYFSRDAIYDPGDQELVSSWGYDLSAGVSRWTTSHVRLPCIESGDYFLIFRVNRDGYLYEPNLMNNVGVVPIQVRIERADLEVSVGPLPAQLTCSPNPKVSISWSVKNNGIGLAETPWSRVDAVYISTNNILDDSARAIQSSYVSELAAGATNSYRFSPRLPVADTGRYFLIFAADVGDRILETTESNNQVAVPIDFEVFRPDLAPAVLLVPAEVTAPPGPSVTVTYCVTNSGPGDVEGANWFDALYMSTNSVFDDTAILVQTFSHWQTVPSGKTYWTTNSVHLPVTSSGKQFLFLKIDRDELLSESNTGNNEIATSLNLNILPPDLAPVSLIVSNSVVSPPYPSVHLVWGVTNQGIGPALGYWVDEFFLSKEPTFSGSATSVFSRWESGPVSAENSYWRTENISLPVSESGDYFLFLRANSVTQLFESSVSNNLVSVPIKLNIGFPDLSPVAFLVTNLVVGTQDPSVRITWAVTNQTDVPALGYWTLADVVFLSTDAKLDESDVPILTSFQEGSLTGHSGYWRIQTATLPVRESGKYYLILATDSGNRLAETREDNNTRSLPITVRIDPPDLAPVALIVPNVVTGSPNTSVWFIAGVTNQGPGDAASYWFDSAFLSADASLNTEEDFRLLYLSSSERGPVSRGGSYWLTNSFRVPAAILPGESLQTTNLFLIFAANDDKTLAESTFANNVLAVPFQFSLEPAPDLALLDFKVLQLSAGSPNPVATIAWGITNQGLGHAEFWSDNLFIATNSVLNPVEFYQGVDSWSGPELLAAGESYWRTNTVTLPVTESGDWYLVLVADFYKNTRDTVLTNNTMAAPISLHVDLPDIELLSLTVSPVLTGSCYPTVSIAWAVTNRGPGSASGRTWNDSLYLSVTPDFQPDWPIAYNPAGLTGSDDSYSKTNDFQLPMVESGVYYLTLKAVDHGYLPESNLANNQLTVPITFNRVDPVLVPTVLIAPGSLNSSPQPEVTLAWSVTNSAPVALQNAWRSEIYLSRSGVDDGSGHLIASFQGFGFASMANTWVTNKVQLPVTESGNYYLMLRIVTDNCGSEPANNVLLKPISINVEPPDIAVAAFLAPSIVKGAPYPEVSVVTCITNLGIGAVAGEWVDALYVSATPFLNPTITPALRWPRTTTIPPGDCLWLTNVVRLPVIDSGDYYLVFRSDVDDSILESSEINNEVVAPIRLDLSLPPGLLIRSFSVPRLVTGPAYPKIEVSWVVENQGLGFAPAPWSDQLLLESAEISPIVLGTFWETNSLSVGETYESTHPIVLPITVSGAYALSLRANASQYSPEMPGQTVGETVWFNFVLTAEPAPVLVAESYQADGFHLSVRGASSRAYRLMASADLIHWERVLDFLCTEPLTRFVDPSASSDAQRFYQVVAGFVPEPFRLSFALEDSPSKAVNVRLDGAPATSYRIETSDDLLEWNVLTNLSGAITPILFQDVAPVQGHKFYRAARDLN